MLEKSLSLCGDALYAQPLNSNGRQQTANIGVDKRTVTAKRTLQKRPHHSSRRLC
jgi:hypothetical protein